MLKEILHGIKSILEGIGEIVFPNVCICCGLETIGKRDQLCSFCREERFVDANPENRRASAGIILPEGVVFQHAMWNFDKGGKLQELIHRLKYERITTIGMELGRLMALRACKHPGVRRIIEHENAILVPVPLHFLKFRSRGFNQSFLIAQGAAPVWDLPVCRTGKVVRKKRTRTQTGFTLQQRIANVRDAFKVRKKRFFRERTVIIIDDVFTTGSTAFELAGTLKKAGSGDILILTVGQA